MYRGHVGGALAGDPLGQVCTTYGTSRRSTTAADPNAVRSEPEQPRNLPDGRSHKLPSYHYGPPSPSLLRNNRFMPAEHAHPEARDDTDTYWTEHHEIQDFSDVDSDSSEITTHSMSTLSSTAVSSYFREIYGRVYPADSNIPSFVPLDDGEAARLELQHHYLKLLIGSNYFGPVRPMLESSSSRRKRVLDIFTADGTWQVPQRLPSLAFNFGYHRAQEMATEFPEVDFVSLDLIPLVPHTPRANVTFEVYDVYNGLAELDESFDIVHTRRTVTQIRDYPAFLVEVSRVLRPGGLLLFGQIEVEVYQYLAPNELNPTDPGETLYPGPHVVQAQHSLPVLSHGLALLRDSLVAQSIRVHMWRELPGLLAPDSLMWQSCETESNEVQHRPGASQSHVVTACARNVHGFRDIVTTAHILPTSPWHPSPQLRALGEIVQQIGESNWRNFGLLFRQHGLGEQEANDLVERGLREGESGKIWQVMQYHTIYATKI